MKKLLRKAIAMLAMFIGLAAGSAMDSDISLGGIFLLVVLFCIGVGGGIALYGKGESVPDVK